MKKTNLAVRFLALSLSGIFISSCTSTSDGAGVVTQAIGENQKSDVDGGSWFSENATLNIHFHSGNKFTIVDENNNLKPVFSKLQEVTGYTLNNVANPVAPNSTDEFRLQAAQQFPADIYGGNSIAPEIMKYGMQGAFIPLNDLIEDYGPNIKNMLKQLPDVQKAITASDGNIYHLPYIPDGKVGRAYFIRTDWLDVLNLEMPKTAEELEKVLISFKEQDPNGNGIKDEIPIFNDKWEELVRLVNIWGARCYGNDTFQERVVLNDNNKLYHAWTDDAFKVGIENLSRWYDMGLIDQEFSTRKQNTARQTLLTKENRGGMTHEWIASTSSYNYSADLLDIAPNFKFEVFLPVSYNGVKGFEEHRRMEAKPDGWAISTNSKDPIAAIKLMDYMFSDEGRILTNYGVEGQTWDMVDGKPAFKESVINETGGVNNFLYQNQGAHLPIGYWMDFDYELQWTSEIGREGSDLYLKKETSPILENITPVLNYNEEEKAAIDRILIPLNEYQSEMILKMITGVVAVEEVWDSYISECKKLGLDELVATYQSAYDRR
jgi:putative aldouronate transport system substrate-binding protein